MTTDSELISEYGNNAECELNPQLYIIKINALFHTILIPGRHKHARHNETTPKLAYKQNSHNRKTDCG